MCPSGHPFPRTGSRAPCRPHCSQARGETRTTDPALWKLLREVCSSQMLAFIVIICDFTVKWLRFGTLLNWAPKVSASLSSSSWLWQGCWLLMVQSGQRKLPDPLYVPQLWGERKRAHIQCLVNEEVQRPGPRLNWDNS